MNFTSKELNKTYILLQAAFQKFLVEDILKFLPSAIKNTPKGELMEGILQRIIFFIDGISYLVLIGFNYFGHNLPHSQLFRNVPQIEISIFVAFWNRKIIFYGVLVLFYYWESAHQSKSDQFHYIFALGLKRCPRVFVQS